MKLTKKIKGAKQPLVCIMILIFALLTPTLKGSPMEVVKTLGPSFPVPSVVPRWCTD